MSKSTQPRPLPVHALRILTSALAIGIMISLSMNPGHADVGFPPWPYQGGLVNPGDAPTRVQMVREEVLMKIGGHERPDLFPYPDTAAEAMGAQVDARFWMQNQGEVVETFNVWFPMWIPSGVYMPNAPQVENLEIWVDGAAEQYEIVEVLRPQDQNQPWGMWEMTFPPRDVVEIRVVYDAFPVGDLPVGTFEYILETGADWWGPIGEGSITVRLPYEVNELNTGLDPDAQEINMMSMDINPGGFEVTDREVVWRFDDLEPSAEDNIRITVMAPQRWEPIEAAQRRVEDSPSDIDARLELARAAVNGLLVFKGSQLSNFASNWALAELARDSFQQALALSNDDLAAADITEYLRLLYWMEEYDRLDPPVELLGMMQAILQENPDEVELVVDYFEGLYSEWSRREYSEFDDPLMPSAASLALLDTIWEIAPDELDWLKGYIEYAETHAVADTPAVTPSPDPTISPPIEQGSEKAGDRGFCPASAAVLFLLLTGGLFQTARGRRHGAPETQSKPDG